MSCVTLFSFSLRMHHHIFSLRHRQMDTSWAFGKKTAMPTTNNSISNLPFFLFVNAFAIVLSVLRFIFSSISHHSIQHSSYSPSISFDTNKERTNNLSHTTPSQQPRLSHKLILIFIACKFIFAISLCAEDLHPIHSLISFKLFLHLLL